MNHRDHVQMRWPCDELAPFVDYYYHYELDAAEQAITYPNGLDVLPGTHVRMGILLDEPTIMSSRIGRMTNPAVGFSGYLTAPVRYTATGSLHLLLIGFTPVGLQQFIDYPVSDLTDRNVSMEFIFPEDYDRIYQAIFSAPTIQAKLAVVEGFLLEKLHIRHFDRRANTIARYILAEGGATSVRSLSDRFVLTERTLQRLFKNNVGISPKHFCKLARFQKAVTTLTRTHPDRLSPLAYNLGYFDQAHFIHEVKQLSGKTPSELASLGRSDMASDFARLRCSEERIFV